MIPYLYLFPKAKGEGNLSVLEPGDLAEGFKDTQFWDCIICRRRRDRASYTFFVETALGD
jgi:hypothetical protein